MTDMFKRNLYLTLGVIFAIILWYITDPNVGFFQVGSGVAKLFYLFSTLSLAFIAVSVLHVFRKIMLPYAVANFEELGKIAITEPYAAAYYALAISTQYLTWGILVAVLLFRV